MHRTARMTKSYPAPNVSSAEVKKPGHRSAAVLKRADGGKPWTSWCALWTLWNIDTFKTTRILLQSSRLCLTLSAAVSAPGMSRALAVMGTQELFVGWSSWRQDESPVSALAKVIKWCRFLPEPVFCPQSDLATLSVAVFVMWDGYCRIASIMAIPTVVSLWKVASPHTFLPGLFCLLIAWAWKVTGGSRTCQFGSWQDLRR